MKEDILKGEVDWSKDNIIAYYDAVCEEVNKTFPRFMNTALLYYRTRTNYCSRSRETVGEAGILLQRNVMLFIVYDNEGKREDVDGKRGKIKAMGLDLKRSDICIYARLHLSELLLKTLTGSEEQEILDRIIEFRKEFRAKNPWQKGSPKRVNNLTQYRGQMAKYEKARNNAHKNGKSVKDIYSFHTDTLQRH